MTHSIGPEGTPRVRRAAIPSDAVLVVRGEDVDDPDASIAQATLFRRRFRKWERYGISAFYARDEGEVADLGSDQLQRFETLLVFSQAELLAAGFELVATFRSPHVTIAFSESPEIAMTRMLAVPHQRFINTAYREDDR